MMPEESLLFKFKEKYCYLALQTSIQIKNSPPQEKLISLQGSNFQENNWERIILLCSQRNTNNLIIMGTRKK